MIKFYVFLLKNDEIKYLFQIVLDFDEKYTILEQIFSGIWWYQWKNTKFINKGFNEEINFQKKQKNKQKN